jgi:ADP-ribosylglycohydrolase
MNSTDSVFETSDDTQMMKIAEDIATGVEKKLQIDNSSDEPEKYIRMTPYKLVSKVAGLIYGHVYGSAIMYKSNDTTVDTNDNNTNILIEQVITILKTFTFDPKFPLRKFVQNLMDLNSRVTTATAGSDVSNTDAPHYDYGWDDFTHAIISHEQFDDDPCGVALDIKAAYGSDYVSSQVPLTRSVMMGVFIDWHDLSVYHCMITHGDQRCIASSILYSATVRSMIMGRLVGVSKLLPETLSLIMQAGKMDDSDAITDMVSYINKQTIVDISTIDMNDDPNNTFKCLSIAMWALGVYTGETSFVEKPSDKPLSECKSDPERFKNVMESVVAQGGAQSYNAAMAGALLGCHSGYHTLSDELLTITNHLGDNIHHKIDDSLMGFFRSIKLASDDDLSVDGLLARMCLDEENMFESNADVNTNA